MLTLTLFIASLIGKWKIADNSSVPVSVPVSVRTSVPVSVRNERMHRTMKAECCQPSSCNHNAQQQRFDRWRKAFNNERPHEALAMRIPADIYQRSNITMDQRIKTRLHDLGDETQKVSESGFIYLDGKNLHVGEALSGSEVALDRNPKSGLIEVRYVNVRLGEYREGQEEKRLRPIGYYKSKTG